MKERLRGISTLRIVALAAFLLAAPLAWPIGGLAIGYYRNFYVPSESMMPTLTPGDRFVARMTRPAGLRRGDIVLIDNGGRIYVQRVAALPGDRIELVDGAVILNGRAVRRRRLGAQRLGDETATRFAELFPGEAAPHQIYDTGYTEFDDMAEQRVAPGHIFLLGDNRDHSADSRVPRSNFGVEQAPLEAVRGAPMFFTSAAGRAFGSPAGH